jgi:hypothetical protein
MKKVKITIMTTIYTLEFKNVYFIFLFLLLVTPTYSKDPEVTKPEVQVAPKAGGAHVLQRQNTAPPKLVQPKQEVTHNKKVAVPQPAPKPVVAQPSKIEQKPKPKAVGHMAQPAVAVDPKVDKVHNKVAGHADEVVKPRVGGHDKHGKDMRKKGGPVTTGGPTAQDLGAAGASEQQSAPGGGGGADKSAALQPAIQGLQGGIGSVTAGLTGGGQSAAPAVVPDATVPTPSVPPAAPDVTQPVAPVIPPAPLVPPAVAPAEVPPAAVPAVVPPEAAPAAAPPAAAPAAAPPAAAPAAAPPAAAPAVAPPAAAPATRTRAVPKGGDTTVIIVPGEEVEYDHDHDKDHDHDHDHHRRHHRDHQGDTAATDVLNYFYGFLNPGPIARDPFQPNVGGMGNEYGPVYSDNGPSLYGLPEDGGLGGQPVLGVDTPFEDRLASAHQTGRLVADASELSPDHLAELASIPDLKLKVHNADRATMKLLTTLTNLRSLSVPNGTLKKLPRSIGRMSNLRALDVSGNQIRELPPEIGQLSRLERLNLRGNQLIELPPSIENLVGLKALDLSHNPDLVVQEDINDWLNGLAGNKAEVKM